MPPEPNLLIWDFFGLRFNKSFAVGKWNRRHCFLMGTGGGAAPPTWDRSRGRHSGTCRITHLAGLCWHGGPDITRQVRLVDHPRPPRVCGLSLFPACMEWQVGRGPHLSNKRSLSELFG